ncbi:PREDICTED: mannose-6-phosphate isomerase 2 [Tarenaya hassleriana]|uniref:mannose-6-phosphate isomerase 2 n=1 Tax=Tarenaya hassleriana TaxID=28532 RepID=UPI00053C766D|nr:PREDICTED: mannose-6-phosphate isomerase 2 [Tarenaya hassleriana]
MGENGIHTNGGDLAGGILRLRCAVKNYEWGKVGSDSLVAGLHEANSGSRVDPAVPYAELWMGTLESGPSHVVPSAENGSGSVTLKSWISENPNVLGRTVLEKWGCDLPFLFKVLSVEKALSIQAHPDKDLAVALHREQPLLYGDDNHKPEMALALSPFEALCGFVSLQELKEVLESVPEITELVGNQVADKILQVDEGDGDERAKPLVRLIFTQLMSAGSDATKDAVSKLTNRLRSKGTDGELLSEKDGLAVRLGRQYPGDIGVMSSLFLNYVKLKPGEALYLGANEPHAYISGECIECMASSDNVVRAGLTPKFRDVRTLCSMLTYNLGYPEILKGFPLSPYITRYLPPFDEFEVDRCDLPSGESTVFPAVPGPSVFLVIEGKGKLQTGSSQFPVNRGDVLFAPSHTEIQVTGDNNEVKLYRAGISSRFFQRKIDEED